MQRQGFLHLSPFHTTFSSQFCRGSASFVGWGLQSDGQSKETPSICHSFGELGTIERPLVTVIHGVAKTVKQPIPFVS
jgi:hypothetical protein